MSFADPGRRRSRRRPRRRRAGNRPPCVPSIGSVRVRSPELGESGQGREALNQDAAVFRKCPLGVSGFGISSLTHQCPPASLTRSRDVGLGVRIRKKREPGGGAIHEPGRRSRRLESRESSPIQIEDPGETEPLGKHTCLCTVYTQRTLTPSRRAAYLAYKSAFRLQIIDFARDTEFAPS